MVRVQVSHGAGVPAHVQLACSISLLVKGLLSLHGEPSRADTIGDRPLGSEVYSSTIHFPKGGVQQLTLWGTLNGPGQLELDPNYIQMDTYGETGGRTLLGYSPLKVQLKPVAAVDPAKKERQIYDVILEKGQLKQKFSLVLSPNAAGAHRLLVREDDQLVHILKFPHHGRDYHLYMERSLVGTSVEEKQAVIQLRKVIGYEFSVGVEGKAVTSLSMSLDAESLDPILPGFKNLSKVYFNGGQLPAAGLKNLQCLSQLKSLEFIRLSIDSDGLACLKDLTQLERLSFSGCYGLSDQGVAHLQGLKNLKYLDLGSDPFITKAPKENHLTDASLKHLAGLTRLEHLYLDKAKITDEELKHLSGLVNLQFLSLSATGITDEGLKHLAVLPKLSTLYYFNTLITSKAYKNFQTRTPPYNR